MSSDAHEPAPSDPTRYITPPLPRPAPTDGSGTLTDCDLPPVTEQTVYPGADSPETTSVTLRIGAYEVLEELGRGGMGVVYKARHQTLGHEVALKMVLSGGHADASELARFRLEAAVARLRHSGIVHTHEFGTHRGRPRSRPDL